MSKVFQAGLKWLNNSKASFPITGRGPRFFKERRCTPRCISSLNNGIKRCRTFEWRAIICFKRMPPRVGPVESKSAWNWAPTRFSSHTQKERMQKRNVYFRKRVHHIGRCGFTVVDLWMCINGEGEAEWSVIIVLYLLRKQLEAANIRPTLVRINSVGR